MTGRIRSENAAARWSFLPLERGAGKATSFAVAELVHTGIARGTCAPHDELRGRCGTRYDEAADASASIASESRHQGAGEVGLRDFVKGSGLGSSWVGVGFSTSCQHSAVS